MEKELPLQPLPRVQRPAVVALLELRQPSHLIHHLLTSSTIAQKINHSTKHPPTRPNKSSQSHKPNRRSTAKHTHPNPKPRPPSRFPKTDEYDSTRTGTAARPRPHKPTNHHQTHAPARG